MTRTLRCLFLAALALAACGEPTATSHPDGSASASPDAAASNVDAAGVPSDAGQDGVDASSGPEDAEVAAETDAGPAAGADAGTRPDAASAGPAQCGDGVDNDSDGLTDWEYDLGCHGPGDPTEAALPRAQENGWTTFDPSPDTQIVYVSSSGGLDTNTGRTPDQAVKTVGKALSMMRSGSPDWMLFKRGDLFKEAIGVGGRSGKGPTERMVFASYGASKTRPRFETGKNGGISLCCKTNSHLAFLDLDFYADTRDPGSATFVGSEGGDAFRQCCDGGANVLIEGCRFRFYLSLVLQTGAGTITNTEFRRNVVADNYGIEGTSHSQGTYGEHLNGLLIEENVYDHNGWNGTVTGSNGTMFNHNTYLSGGDGITLRGNLFLRASSMGNKFRSDVTGGMKNVTVQGNYYFEGEIGVGIGGNTTAARRFEDVLIQDNVFQHVGRNPPSGRDLAWNIHVYDNVRATVKGNYVLLQRKSTNAFGLRLEGGTNESIAVEDNLFYDQKSKAIWASAASAWSQVTVRNNRFQSPTVDSFCVVHSGGFGAATYQGGVYSSHSAPGAWFQVAGANKTFEDWVTASGETGATKQALSFPDPDRSLVEYQASLGATATEAAFFAAAREQSKWTWNPAYTAAAVNAYVRAGFGP